MLPPYLMKGVCIHNFNTALTITQFRKDVKKGAEICYIKKDYKVRVRKM